MKAKLSPRDRRIIDAYFAHGFTKAAALEAAGYTPKSASGLAAKFFRRIDVQDAIRARQEALHEASIASDNEILAILSHALRAGMTLAKYKKVAGDGSLYWDFTGAPPEDLAVIMELTTEIYIERHGDDAEAVKRFKVKHADPTTAAQLLMRHMGMFKDAVNVTGELSLIQVLQQRGRQVAYE